MRAIIESKSGKREIDWPLDMPIPRQGDILILPGIDPLGKPFGAEVLGCVISAEIADKDHLDQWIWRCSLVVDEQSPRIHLVPDDSGVDGVTFPMRLGHA